MEPRSNEGNTMATQLRHHHLAGMDDPVLPVRKRGKELLCEPLLNKGTGFPDSERDALGLRGLVPPQVVSIDDQIQGVMENFHRQDNALARYIQLEALHDCNETLYYRVLLEHIRALTPIIYTPVVGQACSRFGHIYRRARGMYFSIADIGMFDQMVQNWPEDEVEIVVVTDGSRILGLGDLGANGMGIPIGKLSLYVVGAGIYPYRTLPALLDLGTNNGELRDDPLYLGERIPRVTGAAYDEAVEAFVTAIHRRWPHALIQFEDLSNNHAFPLLQHWRERIPCFNDDIQGTGAVALAGLLGALRVTGQQLTEQRICFLGAGSAARGIADVLVAGMQAEGVAVEEAQRHIWMFDTQGLVTTERSGPVAEHKRAYAQPEPPAAELTALIERVKPTVLIGVCNQSGSFTREVLQVMHRHCARPIVFPLSNPTSKAECTATQAYEWTCGAALFASGSPFEPVSYQGRLLVPGQCNNMYIFPGLGMGAIACRARRVTDRMFYVAARTLADEVGEDSLAVGRLYPDLADIRSISARIAAAVCEVAFDAGVAGIERPEDLDAFIRGRMYHPHYVPYEAV
jgi:malate dehydrogenase (oxaloacetate-decarboxylating)(NADP+)